MRTPRPRIVVTGHDRGGAAMSGFTALAVWRAGGRPIRVRPGRPRPDTPFDGLIVGGGADVDPALYAEITRDDATAATATALERIAPEEARDAHADPARAAIDQAPTAPPNRHPPRRGPAPRNAHDPARLAEPGRALTWLVYPLVTALRRLGRIGVFTRLWRTVTRRLGLRAPGLNTAGLDPARDTLETAWLDRAARTGRPVLGICRGMQLINVHRGGSLHRELSSFYVEQPNARSVRPVKRIDIAPGSRLAAITGRERLAVNALHAQAVARIAPTLRATGVERTGVVQAIEAQDGPLVLGVQWHPEFLPHLAAHQALFRALVAAARHARSARL